MLLSARATALVAAGFRVSVLSGLGQTFEPAIDRDGIKKYKIPMRRGISLFHDLGAFFRICWVVWRLNPDLVEFSTPKLGLLGSVAAWICRVPLRVYFLRGLRLETLTGFKRQVLRIAECIAAACSDFVFCNSRSLRQRALDFRIAPASKLIILGDGSSNGVDTSRFAPGPTNIRQRFGIPEEAAVIGFVGRLTSDKGLPELMEAFALILRERPDAYLMLVGWFDAAEDAVERSVRERIESHPRVVLTGFVLDTSPHYRAMDMMVLPSWREGFPNAILEASATGVPVVSTFSTGACDAVVPGVTGILVPPGYPRAISAACLELIQDAERRRRMGSSAREWVREHFSKERVLGLTVDFYSHLMSDGSEVIQGDPDRAEEATGLTASM